MQILKLTGGAAFRLSWGAEPYVVLSVGGFHPAWNPAPLVFPSSLTRIAMVRGGADRLPLPPASRATSRSRRTRCSSAPSVELIINAGPIYARGFLGFDALIIFKPFSFRFDIHASVRVRLGGVNMAGVDLDGTLTGPGPMVLHGRVSIELLFFSISWEDTFVLGSSAPQQVAGGAECGGRAGRGARQVREPARRGRRRLLRRAPAARRERGQARAAARRAAHVDPEARASRPAAAALRERAAGDAGDRARDRRPGHRACRGLVRARQLHDPGRRAPAQPARVPAAQRRRAASAWTASSPAAP